MDVEVEFPSDLVTVEQKQEFVRQLYEWGVENLEDQDDWKYKKNLHKSPAITIVSTSISFEMKNEIDATALKLTFS